MKKARMIQILLLAAKSHKMGNSVCSTLSRLYAVNFINHNEMSYIGTYLYKYFACNPYTPFWLSDCKDNCLKNNQKGTKQRINILLDAAARVEVYGVK